MTFKRVTSPVAGDASHYGGLDINKIADYLGGTDIGASETVDINTLTAFRNSKFTLRNPANTFSYVYVPSAIAANRNVTLPLLTGNDQVTMDNHPTTLTNKTIAYGSNTITGLPSSGVGKAAYKYTIWKNGSNYEAVNNDTGAVDSSNTSIATVFQFAIDAITAAGGGAIFVRKGLYPMAANTEIELKNNITIIGEDKYNTILEQPSSASPSKSIIKTATSANITNSAMYNITLKGSNMDWTLMGIDGSTDLVISNCRFIRTGTPANPRMIIILSDGPSNTVTHERLRFIDNEVAGDCNNDDMVGGGGYRRCIFSRNFIHDNNAGQAIGITSTHDSVYSDNVIMNMNNGNSIGFEGTLADTTRQCEGNTIVGNTFLSINGKLKLAQQDDTTQQHSKSRHNVVTGNVFRYCNAGVEDGNAVDDIITSNIFYRLEVYGIFLTGDHCTVADNHFIDCNYSDQGADIGGISNQKRACIEMRPVGDSGNLVKGNLIHDNIFRNTGASFTIPTEYELNGGLTKTGAAAGILIDDDYSNTYIYNNFFDGIRTDMLLVDRGAATKVWNNQGLAFENAGIAPLPSRRRAGFFVGGFAGTGASTAGTGILTGALTAPTGTAEATPTTQFDGTTVSRVLRRTTGTAAGNNAGIRTTAVFTQRSFNPYLKAKFRLAQTGSQRLYIGFIGGTAADPPNDNDPLNAKAGFMLSVRSTDTTGTFQLGHNDTSGATVFDSITGSAINTSIHTIELWSDANGFDIMWGYRFDDGNANYITSQVPASTDTLGIMFMIQASAASTARSLDQYYLEVQSDN